MATCLSCKKVVHRYKLPDIPKKMIDLANERGGDDNITVIVVQTTGV